MQQNTQRLAPVAKKDLNQYLQDLEVLLKRNTGTGLLVGEDTSSNTPMYIPGMVSDPTGVGSYGPQSPQPQTPPPPTPVDRSQFSFQMPQENSYQAPSQQDSSGWERNSPDVLSEDYQQAMNNPEYDGSSSGSYNPKPIQSMSDGGVLHDDNNVYYSDGTFRQYTGVDAHPYASAIGGGTLYSDGSVRMAASPIRPLSSQQQKPVPLPMSFPGGRTLFSDGVMRDYQPKVGQSEISPQAKKTDPGVVNFFDKFDQGYKFHPQSKDDLSGQCAWFSEQITTLPDGSAWRIGNTIDQKRGYLQNYESAGLAFKPGQDKAQVGNSIVFDEGTTWGHVATISEIYKGKDGKTYYRLSESNYAAPNTVTHDRVVSADDAKIEGILRTKPRDGYELVDYNQAPPIQGQRSLAVDQNASQTGEQERSGQDAPIDKQAQLPPVSRNQSGATAPVMQSRPQSQQPNFTTQQSSQSESSQPLIAQAAQNVFKNVTQAPQKVGKVLGESIDNSEALNQATGGLGLGVSEALQGNLPAAGKEISNTIEKINPTPNIDFGGSELLRGDLAGAKQNFGSMVGRIGTRLNRLPSQIADAVIPGDQSNGQKETLNQNIGYIADATKQKVGDELSKAGEGVKSLAGAGVSALENIFKPTIKQDKRSVGDVSGTAAQDQNKQYSSLMDTASSLSDVAKNDIRDPFFKQGGAEMYKSYLKPNADTLHGGALTLDLFNDDFYKDLGNISSVFGGTKDLNQATDKYIVFERQKYPDMQHMSYQDGYDRGEVDAYNKSVDDYNYSLNDYYKAAKNSVVGIPSIFTPTQKSSSKNVFSSNNGPISFANPVSSLPASRLGPMSPIRQSNSVVPVQKFAAAPMSMPSKSVTVVSPGSNQGPKSVMTSSSFSAPKSSPAPMSVPKKSVTVVSPGANQGPKSVMVAAKSAPAPKSTPAPKSAPAPRSVPAPAPRSMPAPKSTPAPQSKPSNNVFSSVVKAISNIFRR